MSLEEVIDAGTRLTILLFNLRTIGLEESDFSHIELNKRAVFEKTVFSQNLIGKVDVFLH